ncbi:MAG: hypothetical protein RL019_1430 [Pseudomonadota bacterium]|jgi:acyl-CoA synthetase (AMP-forming)/AMP-acid ligase II
MALAPEIGPQQHTIFEVLSSVAHARPNADLLVLESVTAASYGLSPETVSYAQALAATEALRARYAQAGYGHGHRVALSLDNRPEFFFHWWALNALGVSVVPVHAALRHAELSYLLGHSECALVVARPDRHAALQAALDAASSAAAVCAADDAGFAPAPFAAPAAAQPVGRDTECALLYTSGTTGRPKGCRLLNGYFLRAGRWYAELDGHCTLRPGMERIITPLPVNHMNALAFSTMAALMTGGALVQLDRFHPQSWWASVRDSGATVVHYLGVMPAMLLGAPPNPADRTHQVRFGFGAGVGGEQHGAFEERFGFALVEAWAMTETGAVGCVIANHEPRHIGQHAFGKPQAHMAWRVVDDDGHDVASGTPGELWVRGAGSDPRQDFFAGYLKDDAATEEAWALGWFHTGDVVRVDADGCMFFVDRKKNVVRRSGENISAVEVETVLATHPDVKAVAVAPVPDAVRGDEVCACVVPHEAPDNATEWAQALVRWALEQLSYYKVPGYVVLVDELPLTLSQKIQRGQLRELAQSALGQPHAVDTRAMKKSGA